MPTTLLDLPIELFESITSYLPRRGAGSLREVCRQTNRLTTPAFGKRFLQTIEFDYSLPQLLIYMAVMT